MRESHAASAAGSEYGSGLARTSEPANTGSETATGGDAATGGGLDPAT